MERLDIDLDRLDPSVRKRIAERYSEPFKEEPWDTELDSATQRLLVAALFFCFGFFVCYWPMQWLLPSCHFVIARPFVSSLQFGQYSLLTELLATFLTAFYCLAAALHVAFEDHRFLSPRCDKAARYWAAARLRAVQEFQWAGVLILSLAWAIWLIAVAVCVHSDAPLPHSLLEVVGARGLLLITACAIAVPLPPQVTLASGRCWGNWNANSPYRTYDPLHDYQSNWSLPPEVDFDFESYPPGTD